MSRSPQIEDLLREAAPQVLGAVVRRYGDFADCGGRGAGGADRGRAASGPTRACRTNPVGWLVAVASRRMIDRLRSDDARRAARSVGDRGRPSRRLRRTGARRHARPDAVMCCHPALTPGLGDRPDPARGRRPDDRGDRRAPSSSPRRRWRSGSAAPSRRIKASGAAFGMPSGDERARAPALGAARALPDLQRGLRGQQRRRAARAGDLSGEAIRLARIVHAGAARRAGGRRACWR